MSVKYNGWSNYATWRVHLEIFDGYEEPISAEDAKTYVEDLLECDSNPLAESYANAFIGDVNWFEIEEHLK